MNAGFDTASSIAILAISAIAKHGPDGQGIKPIHVIVLPVRFYSFSFAFIHPHTQLLFTTGMTLIDSLDSILMLYSYTGFPEHKFALFVKRGEVSSSGPAGEAPLADHEPDPGEDRPEIIDLRVKMNAMSGLSIILTLMSIVVAFRYFFSSIVAGWDLSHFQRLFDHYHGSRWGRVCILQGSSRGQGQSLSGSTVVEGMGTGQRAIRFHWCRYRRGFPHRCSLLVWITLDVEKEVRCPRTDLVFIIIVARAAEQCQNKGGLVAEA